MFEILICVLILFVAAQISMSTLRTTKEIKQTKDAFDHIILKFIETQQEHFKNQSKILEAISDLFEKEKKSYSNLYALKGQIDNLARANIINTDMVNVLKSHLDNFEKGNRFLKEQNNSLRTKISSLETSIKHNQKIVSMLKNKKE